MIVDIHTHTFPQAIAAATIEKLAGMSHLSPFTHGSNADLAASMARALLLYSCAVGIRDLFSLAAGSGLL